MKKSKAMGTIRLAKTQTGSDLQMQAGKIMTKRMNGPNPFARQVRALRTHTLDTPTQQVICPLDNACEG